MSYADTIFALSTAQGKAGIAVIRVSGLQTCDLFGRILPNHAPIPRQMRFVHYTEPETMHRLDYGLYTYFPAPNSFTGEECIELNIHGGSATVSAMLTALGKMPNFRLAEAGEFSRRGFLNGKFDLTQAESIIDLIEAETDQQRRSALAQSQGSLFELYQQWWQVLLELRAYAEACLDFADEELPSNLEQYVHEGILKLEHHMQMHLNSAQRGERLRHGTTVAIIGPSNAGKSSLLNHFTQQPTAIISPIAGTTRDSLVHHIEFAGFALKLVDTAGFQQTKDIIEQEGIRRAKQHATTADLILVLFDGTNIPTSIDEYLEICGERPKMIIINKKDLNISERLLDHPNFSGHRLNQISLHTGEGITEFHQTLIAQLKPLAGFDDTPIITHARYQQAVQQSLWHLEKAKEKITPILDLELLAEELKSSQDRLGEIIGKANVENLLDIIFSKFCIGK